MKAITVAMEVSPKGDVIREAFTMVHGTIKTAEQWQKDLPKQFDNNTYRKRWKAPRVKVADAIKERGNSIKAQCYLFV